MQHSLTTAPQPTAARPAHPPDSGPVASVDPCFDRTVRLAAGLLGAAAAAVVTADGSGGALVLAEHGGRAGFAGRIDADAIGDGADPVLAGDAAAAGAPAWVRALAADGWRAAAAAGSGAGGAVVVLHDAPRAWTAEHAELLAELALGVERELRRRTAEAEAAAWKARHAAALRGQAGILEQLAEGVIVADAGGRVRFLNRAAERIHGTGRLDVPPEAFPEAYAVLTASGEPYPWSDFPLARAVRDGVAVEESEWRIRHPDGTERVVRGSARPTPGPDGESVGAVLTLRDVTEQRAVEARLHLLERAVEAVSEGILIADAREPGQPLLFANPGFERLTGYPLAEVIGFNCRFLQGDRTDPFAVARLRSAIRSGSPVVEDLINYRRDGTPFWNRLSLTPIVDPEGKITHWAGIVHDVTTIHQAQEERAAAEEHYRRLVKTSPLGIFVVDREARLTESNAAFANTFGRDAASLVGVPFLDLLTPVHRFRAAHAFDRMLGGDDEEVSLELHIRRPDGEERVVSVVATTIRHGSRIEGVHGVVQDVTERTAAERALRESEERFRQIAENIREVFWVRSPGAAYLDYLSPAFEEVWGCSAEAVRNDIHRWWETIVEEDRALLGASVDDVREHGTRDNVYRIRRSDGAIRWIHDRSFPVRDDEGVVQRIIGLAEDITEQVRAQQALRERERQLAEAQGIARVGSWEWDPGGCRVVWSDEHFRLWGLEPGAAAPTPELFLEAVHPDDRERVWAALEQAGRDGAPVAIEYRIVRRDGLERVMHTRAEVLADEEGGPNRMIGTVQDVTERKELEEQLRQSQKMEAVGQLAGGVAHDFNNMLTAISGHARLLESSLPVGTTAREDLREIQRAADRSAALTRQLLAFSRRQILQPRALDLNETVRGMEGMLRPLIGETIRIETVLAADGPQVHADPGQVEQVILNLVVNARDAMPDGGRIRIETGELVVGTDAPPATLGELSPGRYATLSVTDTGQGIEPHLRERIFEPFFTTKEVGSGTGLGLSTVYGIVQQSGGSLEVWSEPGLGSTFTIFLPATPTAPAPVPAPAPAAAAAAGEGTVLVVEDEAAVRSLVSRILQRAGYRVLTAATGPEAVRVASTEGAGIDLLLTDVVMPELNGGEVAAAVRALHPAIRVLFMSGYTDDVLGRYATPGQSMELLEKPFSPEELAARVAEVLRRDG